MTHWTLGILLCGLSLTTFAHPTTDSIDWKADSEHLSQLMELVLTDTSKAVRQSTSDRIQQTLEELLQAPGAYAYPFDELRGISVLQPASKAFRIFTWQLYLDDNNYRYKGIIQTKGGKIYPLKDGSDGMKTVEFSTYRHNDWYGALYYNLQAFQHKGQECYLLFGYDAYSFYNRRKVLDVLYFDDKGDPRFGKAVLEMKDGRGQIRTVKRMLLEYASSVNVSLNYSEAESVVKYDHLIYGAPIPGGGPSSVPDGSYSGLKYNPRAGTWQYIDKLYKDDPNNVLIDATSYGRMVQDGNNRKKKKKDLFGRMR